MFFEKEKKEIKEPFCGACVAGVAAIAGAGATGTSTKIKDRKKQKIIFWSGVIITIISILILIYILFIKKCGSCR